VKFSNYVPMFRAFTNPLWARVVGDGPFSLCVIHMDGLYSSSRDINRLMMFRALFRVVKEQRFILAYTIVLCIRAYTRDIKIGIAYTGLSKRVLLYCRPSTSLQRKIRARSRQSSLWNFYEKAVSFVR
jgi:hypothetical protein